MNKIIFIFCFVSISITSIAVQAQDNKDVLESIYLTKDKSGIGVDLQEDKTTKKIAPTSLSYILVKRGPTPVRKELNPQSPILGMAKRGSHYPLLGAGDAWCKILFNGQQGWIQRQYIKIVKTKKESFVLQEFLVIIGIICFILIICILIFHFGNRNNKIKSEWFSAEKVSRKILIVSNTNTQVQRFLTNKKISLESCFTEVGFEVKKTSDSNTTMKLIYHYFPDAIAVDWNLGSNVMEVMKQILTGKSDTRSIFLLFYNVPVHELNKNSKSHVLSNARYLGLSFTDRDLFDIITPLMITGERKHTIQKSIEQSALQGDIADSNLSEVFQFIEIGNKTGCLLIEDNKPSGIIYFNNGIIIYAASGRYTGQKAVLEILDLQNGQFHFVLNRQPKSSNCSIQILGILMEWTKEKDETSGNRLR